MLASGWALPLFLAAAFRARTKSKGLIGWLPWHGHSPIFSILWLYRPRRFPVAISRQHQFPTRRSI